MSLSPLIPSQVTNLRVRTTTHLHPRFRGLHAAQDKITTFRVVCIRLEMPRPAGAGKDSKAASYRIREGLAPVAFASPVGFGHPKTRRMHTLRDPCFKTGDNEGYR